MVTNSILAQTLAADEYDEFRRLASCAEVRNLIATNPALAHYLVAHLKNQKNMPSTSPGQWHLLFAEKRRKICAMLGLPGTSRTVNILRKLPESSCDHSTLENLRILVCDRRSSKFLDHLPLLTSTVVALLHAKFIPYVRFDTLIEFLHHDFDTSLQDILRTALDSPESDLSTCFQSLNNFCRLMAAARREDQEQFPAPPIVLPPYFVPLSTPKELAAEGHTLRNCVGGYAGKVRRSKCYVFKLEAPERATVSLVSVNGRWKLGEIKGPRNREVRWDTKEFVAEWIERSQNGKAESFPMPDHEFPEIANFRPIAFTPAPLSPPAQLEPITSSVRLLNRPGVPRDRMEDLIEDLRCRGAYGNPSCEAYAFNLSAPVSATVILGTRKGTDGEICWEISEIIPHGNDQITWDIYESVRAAVEYEGNSPSLLNEPTKHQSIQLTL